MKNIIKPDDELILLREDIKIMTDREGKIKDINIKLVSKKTKNIAIYMVGMIQSNEFDYGDWNVKVIDKNN